MAAWLFHSSVAIDSEVTSATPGSMLPTSRTVHDKTPFYLLALQSGTFVA